MHWYKLYDFIIWELHHIYTPNYTPNYNTALVFLTRDNKACIVNVMITNKMISSVVINVGCLSYILFPKAVTDFIGVVLFCMTTSGIK